MASGPSDRGFVFGVLDSQLSDDEAYDAIRQHMLLNPDIVRGILYDAVHVCLYDGGASARPELACRLVRDADRLPSDLIHMVIRSGDTRVLDVALFKPDGTPRVPADLSEGYGHQRQAMQEDVLVRKFARAAAGMHTTTVHDRRRALRALCELSGLRTDGRSAVLHMAGVRAMKMLLEHVTDKEARDRSGISSTKHLEACRVLVEAGANVNARGDDGDTALHQSARLGDCSLIAYLVSVGADLETPGGTSPLHAAAMRGHGQACELLLRLGARPNATCGDGNTALHLAALYGRTGAVDAILRGGGDATLKNNNGFLAIHYAVGAAPVDTCEMLLHAGSPVNAPDANGDAPVVIAALKGRADVMRTLLRHGATPSVTAPWWARKLARQWAAGEDHEQVAARAVHEAADRHMLPELAAICAAYLVVPAPRDTGGDRNVVDGSEANWGEDWEEVD